MYLMLVCCLGLLQCCCCSVLSCFLGVSRWRGILTQPRRGILTERAPPLAWTRLGRGRSPSRLARGRRRSLVACPSHAPRMPLACPSHAPRMPLACPSHAPRMLKPIPGCLDGTRREGAGAWLSSSRNLPQHSRRGHLHRLHSSSTRRSWSGACGDALVWSASSTPPQKRRSLLPVSGTGVEHRCTAQV